MQEEKTPEHTKKPVEQWTIDDVYAWAKQLIDEEDAQHLTRQKVNGRALLRLVTKEDFVLCGIPVGPASDLAEAVLQLKAVTTGGPGATDTDEVKTLKRKLDEMEKEYKEEIAKLQQDIKAIKSESKRSPRPANQETETPTVTATIAPGAALTEESLRFILSRAMLQVFPPPTTTSTTTTNTALQTNAATSPPLPSSNRKQELLEYLQKERSENRIINHFKKRWGYTKATIKKYLREAREEGLIRDKITEDGSTRVYITIEQKDK